MGIWKVYRRVGSWTRLSQKLREIPRPGIAFGQEVRLHATKYAEQSLSVGDDKLQMSEPHDEHAPG